MIYHTENETTCKYGQAIATVICDSIFHERRITTLELVYPRFIHSELMTHRMFSRNASSSRATPIDLCLNEVRNDCTFFDRVGMNQKGMTAKVLLSDDDLESFKKDWFQLAKTVADEVSSMSNKYHIHKQVLNRALEPFSRIRTLVTATNWSNFFNLRLSNDAQPEMFSLATAMYNAIENSTPVERTIHAPYVDDNDVRCSVARCARVSYGKANGDKSTIADDIKLFNSLLKAGHMSPFEHVAYAKAPNKRYANFLGWESYRKQLEF